MSLVVPVAVLQNVPVLRVLRFHHSCYSIYFVGALLFVRLICIGMKSLLLIVLLLCFLVDCAHAWPSAAKFLSGKLDEVILACSGVSRLEFITICEKYGGPGTPLTP